MTFFVLFISNGDGVAIRKNVNFAAKFREAASFSAPFSKGEKGERKLMRKNKEYRVQVNPRTGFQLRNNEVCCSFCGRNFGDIRTLQKHRVKTSFGEIKCVDPQSVNMTAHVNRYLAIIWKYSKW